MTDVPSLHEGFNSSTIYSNVYHLLELSKCGIVPLDIRRIIPWVVWRIWKNRNLLALEGRRFRPIDSLKKIKEESIDWFLAQVVEEEQTRIQNEEENLDIDTWKPTYHLWLKCNIGRTWSKDKRLGGGAWVIRDDKGEVILHSKRAFSGMTSLEETKMQVLIWAIFNVKNHKMERVIFS